MLPRHLAAARSFQANHFGYFPEIEVAAGGGGGSKKARVFNRLGTYVAELSPHQIEDEDAIILAVVVAVAEHEL